jgi:hypothetical protein
VRTVDPDPARVAQTVASLILKADAPVSAYWLGLAGHRDDFAAQLRPLLSEVGIAVLIVRREGFDNPNALMVDLVHLLEQNRPTFLAALARRRHDPDRLGIVLLARSELKMAQSYSPVIWPDWVPGVGNREEICFITDVGRRIDAPLNAEEVDVKRVQHALFKVEEALLRRLLQVHARDPSAHAPLFQMIRRRSDPGWADFLARAKTCQGNIRTTESYRPSRRSGESVVSRLWELNRVRSSADVAAAASALAGALDLAADWVPKDHKPALLTVLARPTDRKSAVVEPFCRNLVLTVDGACQYITCSVHVEEYQLFPINLLTSIVDDLYRSLVDIETSLIHLPDHGAGDDALPFPH